MEVNTNAPARAMYNRSYGQLITGVPEEHYHGVQCGVGMDYRKLRPL
jgi:hypothetical protein